MFTKVCGLINKGQIDKAIEFGYDAIGVVTCPKSKRYCTPNNAIELAEYAKGKIKTFVVGVTYDDVKDASEAFDFTQIYEIKQLPRLVLSSKEIPPVDLNYEYFIYDASEGRGIFKNFPTWLNNFSGKLIIAGGLNKDNVSDVIREFKPYGVDVSSGVEKDGIKNFKLMKEFIHAVKKSSASCAPKKSAVF